MNQSVNDEAVCRTAPATPGLLNTSIPPGVLSFQVVFVNKFNLMEDILPLLFWPVSKGLDLIYCRNM